MNIDQLFDKAERNPIRAIAVVWIIGTILSLIGIALAILVVIAILNGFGVV